MPCTVGGAAANFPRDALRVSLACVRTVHEDAKASWIPVTFAIRMIHSYDVFDTCLTRRVAVPTDLMRLVARNVAALRQVEATPRFVDEVSAARVDGENLARRGSWANEVTLEEIWRATADHLGWVFSTALVEAELETEAETLHPLPAMLEEVERARQSGARIIFVSDTYLPEAFLKRILAREGFFREGDGLHVSNVAGKSKARGDLYGHVLAVEGVKPSEVRHVGDKVRSDVLRARDAGIQGAHREPARFNHVELSVATAPHLPAESTSLWAGAIRESRLQTGSDPEPGILLGTRFVGPVLFAFVAWVLAEARKDGIEHLHFASRDGRMALEVARRLGGRSGDPDLHYLHISRQALLLPTSTEISPRGMPWMRRPSEVQELRRLLARVELEIDQHPEAWEPLVRGRGDSYVLTTEADWEAFWRILSGPAVGPELDQLIRKRRQSTLAYLESRGVTGTGRRAVVDLGWRLSSQAALNTLLRSAGHETPVAGYSLESGVGRAPPRVTGPAASLFPALAPDRARLVGRRTPVSFARVLEHTLGMADHPSVHHYEVTDRDGAVPCSAGGPIEADAGVLFPALLASAEAFAETNRDHAHLMVPDAAMARGVIQIFLDEFLARPPGDVAEELLELSASEKRSHRRERPLVRPLTIGEELGKLLPRTTAGSSRTAGAPWWPEGSRALTPAWVNRTRGWIAAAHPAADRFWSKVARSVPSSIKSRLRKTRA
jgi:FMN phosphatase YigB (HAD superfamily)